MEHQIIVVGIGPGAPEYLTPAAQAAIEAATALVGSKRALETYAPPGVKTRAITGDLAAAFAFIEACLAAGDVTVLVSGDPGYYSLLAALRARFGAARLRVIPGLSSMQLAFARLALPWQNARLLSFHGRVPDEAALRWEAGGMLGLLTDTVYDSKAIAARLLTLGWPKDAPAHVCARLSYADERIRSGTLSEAARQDGVSHCIMIVEG